MSFFGGYVQVVVQWFWSKVSGGMLHKCLVRVWYFPSLLRMSLLEGPKRRWYDRIDPTVVLGALPFKSQVKKVRELKANEGSVKCGCYWVSGAIVALPVESLVEVIEWTWHGRCDPLLWMPWNFLPAGATITAVFSCVYCCFFMWWQRCFKLCTPFCITFIWSVHILDQVLISCYVLIHMHDLFWTWFVW